MKPIFLIGYMGCGKSTLGRALARRLGRQFIDLDKYIESRFMSSIPDLFAKRGEEGFRRIEHNMLHEVAECEDVVIACGGGTPCHFDNMQYMNSCGDTVWLQASEARLHERLCIRRYRRPILANLDDEQVLQKIREMLPARTPFYSQARYTISADRLESTPEIEDTVDLLLSVVSC